MRKKKIKPSIYAGFGVTIHKQGDNHSKKVEPSIYAGFGATIRTQGGSGAQTGG